MLSGGGERKAEQQGPEEQVLRTKLGGWGWRPRHKNPGAKLSTCAIVPADLTDKIKLKGKIVKNFKTATANHQTLSARPF